MLDCWRTNKFGLCKRRGFLVAKPIDPGFRSPQSQSINPLAEALSPDTPNLALPRAVVQGVLDGQPRTDAKLDRIVEDPADLKLRTTNTEEALADVNRRLDLANA